MRHTVEPAPYDLEGWGLGHNPGPLDDGTWRTTAFLEAREKCARRTPMPCRNPSACSGCICRAAFESSGLIVLTQPSHSVRLTVPPGATPEALWSKVARMERRLRRIGLPVHWLLFAEIGPERGFLHVQGFAYWDGMTPSAERFEELATAIGFLPGAYCMPVRTPMNALDERLTGLSAALYIFKSLLPLSAEMGGPPTASQLDALALNRGSARGHHSRPFYRVMAGGPPLRNGSGGRRHNEADQMGRLLVRGGMTGALRRAAAIQRALRDDRSRRSAITATATATATATDPT